MADENVSQTAERMGVVMLLPTSCAEAVQQSHRRGRYPKAIGRIGDARAKRNLAACKEERERQEKIARLQASWLSALGFLKHIEDELKELGSEHPSRTKTHD
jgi:hypothetical protein